MRNKKLFEELIEKPGFWSVSGPNNDIVLSSRIRLARNIKSAPFPNNFDFNEADFVKGMINEFVNESTFKDNLTLIDISGIDSNEKRFLRERNIITNEMEDSDNSLVAINNIDDFTILVNEEDHFRIQVIRPGLQLVEAYRFAEKVDDELNKFVPYAYSNELGYLSACPSNLGTGMKCSVILHLPVITMRNKINEAISGVDRKDIEIKGTVRDKEKNLGGIYQVSNKISLGISEIDIIEMLDSVINNLLELEDIERDVILSEYKLDFEDEILRSYGILKYLKRISYTEAMEHLSNIRLGVITAVIRNNPLNLINDLMVNIQWSHLQRHYSRIFKSTIECERYRAKYIINTLQ